MTDRGMSAAMLAEIALPHNRPYHLFEATFDDETVRNTDAYRDIVWSSNTYLANGDFMRYTGLDESADLQAHQVGIELSGVDQTFVSIVLSKEYINRSLKIWRVFLDTARAVVVDPVPLFFGTMDNPTIDDNPFGSSTVSLTATNQLADWRRPRGRHTNDNEQQLYAAGDRGFEFVSPINRTLVWGKGFIRPEPGGASPAPVLAPPVRVGGRLGPVTPTTGAGGGDQRGGHR